MEESALSGAFISWGENCRRGIPKKNIESCVRCHFPIRHSSGETNLPLEDKKGGVICDFCHSVRATTGIGNAPYILSPGNAEAMEGGIKYGPFNDSPDTIHKNQYSELHTRSEFCGGCHDVSHAGNDLPIEQTYTEWRQGPYNTTDPKTTVHCQDCHMRQRRVSRALAAQRDPIILALHRLKSWVGKNVRIYGRTTLSARALLLFPCRQTQKFSHNWR